MVNSGRAMTRRPASASANPRGASRPSTRGSVRLSGSPLGRGRGDSNDHRPRNVRLDAGRGVRGRRCERKEPGRSPGTHRSPGGNQEWRCEGAGRRQAGPPLTLPARLRRPDGQEPEGGVAARRPRPGGGHQHPVRRDDRLGDGDVRPVRAEADRTADEGRARRQEGDECGD